MTEPCARCQRNPGDIYAYWGAVLCRSCARTVAVLLDEHDRWPSVPWSDEEVDV